MSNRDPLADWQAMGQQYWQGLTELGQKFIKPQPVAAAPWAQGLDQWTQLFKGQPSSQQGVFEQLMAQGKTYVSTLEELFKAGAGGSQNLDLAALARSSLEQFRNSQPWMQGLGDYGKWMDPAALEKLVGMMGGAASQQALPAFGFNREQQERLQQLQDDLKQYQQETQRYNALINKSLEGAIKRMEDKLAERSEPGRQLNSIKSVYDLWVDALEESYAEIALSPEFREVYGALVNSQMKVKAGVQAQIERSTGELGMPTRSELDGVHRKLSTVRSQLREVDQHAIEALRQEVVALKTALAELKAASGKAETVVVASRPRSKPAAATAAVVREPSASVVAAAPEVAPPATTAAEPVPAAPVAAPAKTAARKSAAKPAKR